METPSPKTPFGTLQKKSRVAVVRFVGKTGFAGGDWVGVELSKPEGLNDGSVHGTRYFECRPGHGLFVRLGAVAKVRAGDLLRNRFASKSTFWSDFGRMWVRFWLKRRLSI